MATPRDVRRVAAMRRNSHGKPPVPLWGAGRTGAGLVPRQRMAWLMGDWVPPAGLAPATEDEALSLPPFGRGLALLANAVASTDWHAQRWDASLGVDVRLADQPSVVTDPNPLVTTWEYRWAATEDLVLYGNHFAIPGDPDYRTNLPGFLVPVPADAVWVLTDPSDASWLEWVINGVEFAFTDLFHVSSGARSGEFIGRGVLAQYAATLGGYVAAERFSGDYFAGGTLPPAVLQSPTVLTQEQADDLKAKWRTLTSTREPVVLPSGYVLTPIVTNADDAQLVQSRQWDATLVAMILGIPPWKLGLAGPSMTYSNIETADIDFIRDSADRYARPLAAAFSKWLMPRGTSVVFDYAQRMRADQATTMTVLTGYVRDKVLSEDEARAAIGRPPQASTDVAGTTPAGTPELTPTEVTQ